MQQADFGAKKTNTNLSNKIDKQLLKHHKTNRFYQKNVFTKLGEQKEVKYDKANCKKTGSNTEENMQDIKSAK